MEQNILQTEKISTLALKYCVPAIIGMAITGTQTMIDGLFVGNFIGSDAMAAVNIANPFVQIIIGISMVISIGCLSHLGITLGIGDIKKSKSIYKTSFQSLVVLGSLVTLIGLFFSQNLALVLGANEVLLHDVATYIQTIACFTLPMVLMFFFGFMNRLLERPELYVKGMILSVIFNILLNTLLIAVFELGVLGAAIATGMSYVVALLIVIRPGLDKKSLVNVHEGTFELSELKPVIYNGSSEGINSISVAISAFVFNMAFMSIAGEDGVAAFTTINYIAGFGIMVMFGVSDGIGPIASYNFGSRDFSRVKSILKLSYAVISIISLLVFVTLLAFSEQLVQLFISDDDSLVSFATQGGQIYALSFLCCGFNILYSGFFTSIGNARASIIVALSRGLIFVLLGIAVLPAFFGVNGVWFVVPFAEIITFGISLLLLRSVNKQMNEKECLS